jgi:hypothetical protein
MEEVENILSVSPVECCQRDFQNTNGKIVLLKIENTSDHPGHVKKEPFEAFYCMREKMKGCFYACPDLFFRAGQVGTA